MTADSSTSQEPAYAPGDRVIRTLHGIDFPGTAKSAPWVDDDGREYVRVAYDQGSGSSVPTADLRPLDRPDATP